MENRLRPRKLRCTPFTETPSDIRGYPFRWQLLNEFGVFKTPQAAQLSREPFVEEGHGRLRLFVCNFSATCEAVCPWGSLPKSCNNRNQLLGNGMSLLPFDQWYPEPGGGRRTIRPPFIAALGQRPPRAARALLGCGL